MMVADITAATARSPSGRSSLTAAARTWESITTDNGVPAAGDKEPSTADTAAHATELIIAGTADEGRKDLSELLVCHTTMALPLTQYATSSISADGSTTAVPPPLTMPDATAQSGVFTSSHKSHYPHPPSSDGSATAAGQGGHQSSISEPLPTLTSTPLTPDTTAQPARSNSLPVAQPGATARSAASTARTTTASPLADVLAAAPAPQASADPRSPARRSGGGGCVPHRLSSVLVAPHQAAAGSSSRFQNVITLGASVRAVSSPGSAGGPSARCSAPGTAAATAPAPAGTINSHVHTTATKTATTRAQSTNGAVLVNPAVQLLKCVYSSSFSPAAAAATTTAAASAALPAASRSGSLTWGGPSSEAMSPTGAPRSSHSQSGSVMGRQTADTGGTEGVATGGTSGSQVETMAPSGMVLATNTDTSIPPPPPLPPPNSDPEAALPTAFSRHLALKAMTQAVHTTTTTPTTPTTPTTTTPQQQQRNMMPRTRPIPPPPLRTKSITPHSAAIREHTGPPVSGAPPLPLDGPVRPTPARPRALALTLDMTGLSSGLEDHGSAGSRVWPMPGGGGGAKLTHATSVGAGADSRGGAPGNRRVTEGGGGVRAPFLMQRNEDLSGARRLSAAGLLDLSAAPSPSAALSPAAGRGGGPAPWPAPLTSSTSLPKPLMGRRFCSEPQQPLLACYAAIPEQEQQSPFQAAYQARQPHVSALSTTTFAPLAATATMAPPASTVTGAAAGNDDALPCQPATLLRVELQGLVGKQQQQQQQQQSKTGLADSGLAMLQALQSSSSGRLQHAGPPPAPPPQPPPSSSTERVFIPAGRQQRGSAAMASS